MSFQLTDYIITPMDIVRGVLSLFRRSMLKNWGIAFLLILIFYFANSFFGWQFEFSFFFVFFLSMFLWDIDSRLSIGLALFSLVTVPLMLYLQERVVYFALHDWSDQFAVWAFYFLVIGVAKQIWDLNKKEIEKVYEEEKEKFVLPKGLARNFDFPLSGYILDLRKAQYRK